MAEPMTLQACSGLLYDRAKRWWTATNVLRLGTVAAGVSATLLGLSPLTTSLVAGLLALSAWWAQYKTDSARDAANDLRRQMDLRDGLGWPVSSLALADLGATVGVVVTTGPPAEPYFESVEPPGPRRLAEHVRETGFFSEHLAATAEQAMWWVTAALVFLTVSGLFATLVVVDDVETARTVGAVLASVLLAVEATGVASLALAYRGFRRAACEAKADANRMLSGPGLGLVEAVHLAESYYVNRARAPLLPGWAYSGVRVGRITLYPGRRDELNRLWRQGYGAPRT